MVDHLISATQREKPHSKIKLVRLFDGTDIHTNVLLHNIRDRPTSAWNAKGIKAQNNRYSLII